MRRLAWLVVLIGCGGARSTKVTPEVSVDDYLMLLEDGLSWTYRDDGDMITSPENAQLLRARNAGEGVLDFRRGSRWADGDPEGLVAFAQSDRLRVIEWVLGDSRGSGDYPLATTTTEEGKKVANGSWTCTTERPDVVATYYGDFSDVLTFSCNGGQGPAGEGHFAYQVGLVAFDSESYQLDLVAPW